MRGQIFESWVISEYVKRCHHAGERPNAFFWRDRHGNEIDLLLEEGETLHAVEIKSGETLHDGFFRGLAYFRELSSQGA